MQKLLASTCTLLQSGSSSDSATASSHRLFVTDDAALSPSTFPPTSTGNLTGIVSTVDGTHPPSPYPHTPLTPRVQSSHSSRVSRTSRTSTPRACRGTGAHRPRRTTPIRRAPQARARAAEAASALAREVHARARAAARAWVGCHSPARRPCLARMARGSSGRRGCSRRRRPSGCSFPLWTKMCIVLYAVAVAVVSIRSQTHILAQALMGALSPEI